MTGGISKKEVKFISELEFKKKYFFTRKDIIKYFTSEQEIGVYLHRMKKKGRIEKISRSKYYLIPIRALRGRWTEHAFIVADEIFDSKDYFIGGKSAAHYWHLIDQIPFRTDVFTTKKQGFKKIFSNEIYFRRVRKLSKKMYTVRYIKGHPFNIAKKKVSEKWV